VTVSEVGRYLGDNGLSNYAKAQRSIAKKVARERKSVCNRPDFRKFL